MKLFEADPVEIGQKEASFMSNKQSTASYAFPLALGAGGSTAIALDHYLMRLTIGVGL